MLLNFLLSNPDNIPDGGTAEYIRQNMPLIGCIIAICAIAIIAIIALERLLRYTYHNPRKENQMPKKWVAPTIVITTLVVVITILILTFVAITKV